jgi:hypothetical protein
MHGASILKRSPLIICRVTEKTARNSVGVGEDGAKMVGIDINQKKFHGQLVNPKQKTAKRDHADSAHALRRRRRCSAGAETLDSCRCATGLPSPGILRFSRP